MNDIQRILTRVVFVAAVAMSGATVGHADVTFTDSTFGDADWTGSIVDQTGLPASFVANQISSGGNPGPYRALSHVYGGPGSIITAHLQNAAVYNPSTQGAFTQLDASFDLLLLDGGVSGVVGYGVTVFQNGSYYIHAFSEIAEFESWTSHTNTGLTSSNFVLIQGGGPAQPNFSSSGFSGL